MMRLRSLRVGHYQVGVVLTEDQHDHRVLPPSYSLGGRGVVGA